MISRKILTELPSILCINNVRCWGNVELLSQSKILSKLIRPSHSEVTILKEYSRRYIFRIFSQALQTSFVVKSFPFKRYHEKRRYKRYGLQEFTNYNLAKRAGIPIPECYAYFERRYFGIVQTNGIVIEDLQGYQDLGELAQETKKKLEVLSQAIPSILLCFQKGANHIDLTPSNILINSSQKIKILDWQYCKFLQPKQVAQLVFHSAHFLRYAEVDYETNRQWLKILHSQSNLSISIEKFTEQVFKLMTINKIETSDRLELNIGKYMKEL